MIINDEAAMGTSVQCEQMTALFTTMKICPIAYTQFAEVGSTFCAMLNKSSNKSQSLVKCFQSGEISLHLVTLLALDSRRIIFASHHKRSKHAEQ